MNVLSKVVVDLRELLVPVSVAVLRILRLEWFAHTAEHLQPPWPLWPTLRPSKQQPTTTFQALEDQQPQGREEQQEGGQSPREEPSSMQSLSTCRINDKGVPTYEALHFYECAKPTMIDEVKFPGIDVDDEEKLKDGTGGEAVFHAEDKVVMHTAGRAQEAVAEMVAPLMDTTSETEQEEEQVEAPMSEVQGEPNADEADDGLHGVSPVGSKRKESDAGDWETPQQKRPKAMSEADGSLHSVAVHVEDEKLSVGGEDDGADDDQVHVEESSGLAMVVDGRELVEGVSGDEDEERAERRGVVHDDETNEKPTASSVAPSDSSTSDAVSAPTSGSPLILPSGEPRLEQSSGVAAAMRAGEPIGESEDPEPEPAVKKEPEVDAEKPTASAVRRSDASVSEELPAPPRDIADDDRTPHELRLEESSGVAAALDHEEDHHPDSVDTHDAVVDTTPKDDATAASEDRVRTDDAAPTATALPRGAQSDDVVWRRDAVAKTTESLSNHQTHVDWEASSGLGAPFVDAKTGEKKSASNQRAASAAPRQDEVSTSFPAPQPLNASEAHTLPPAVEESSGLAAAYESAQGLAEGVSAAFMEPPTEERLETWAKNGPDVPEGSPKEGDQSLHDVNERAEPRHRVKSSLPIEIVSAARPHASGTLVAKDNSFHSSISTPTKQSPSLTRVLETPEVHSLALTAPSASAFGMALRGPTEASSPTQHSAFEDLLKPVKGVVSRGWSPTKAATVSKAPCPRRESVRSNDTEDTENDRHLEEIDSNDDGEDEEEDNGLLAVRDSEGNVAGVLAMDPVAFESPHEPTVGSEVLVSRSNSGIEWSSDSDSFLSDSDDPVFSSVPPALQQRVISVVFYTI